MHSKERSELTVLSTQQMDLTTYQCFANNSLNTISFALQLKAPGKPDEPFTCTVLNITSYTARLACAPGYDGGVEYLNSIGQDGGQLTFPIYVSGPFVKSRWVPTKEQASGSLVIVEATELDPNITHELRVFSRNKFNTSDVSLTVTVNTLGDYCGFIYPAFGFGFSGIL